MVFSSTVFLFVFLPIILIVYYNPFFKNRKFRNIVLLIGSLGFYAWGEPVFVFVMMGSIVINWAAVLQMSRAQTRKGRRAWLWVAVVIDLLMLFVFKYLGFVTENLHALINALPITEIALPIGISFFTFQMLSYVFDVYYGKAQVQRNVLNVALYISLFSQLIAGPIVRYETVADEITGRTETKRDFTEGMVRFIIGLAKKVLLANYVGLLADNAFATLPQSLSVATAWLGAIAYALQIYFDFSGYSDMAIGLGRMFGFHFNENFRYPYIADSVSDFWRRWHISLSSWFRDYVYIPMGGNRVAKGRWILNIFVVWLLTGIWHGANWTFILWGLYYFALLLIERLTGFTRKLKGFSHVYTLLAVTLGWVLFRSESLSSALEYLGVMFGFGGSGLIDAQFRIYLTQGMWMLLAAVIACFPVVPWIKKRLLQSKLPARHAMVDMLRALSVIAICALTLICCIKSTYNPFIYFNF